jgi:hypothetical protein
MKKSINDNRKIGRGRPATGTAPLVGVRMSEGLQGEIRAWAKKQEDKPSLAAAIRRLVELGLTVKTNKPKQVPAERPARAKELASKVIDSLTVGASNDDEKATRKRRLIKCPEEFREMRADRAKAK